MYRGRGCSNFWAKLTRRKVIDEEAMKSDLSRVLTPLAVVMIGIGQMASGGAFVVLGEASRLAGPGVVLSFAIGSLVAFTTGMCYAEFAATIPKAGSGYLFTYVTVGEFLAFIVGWQVILEEVISVSSMSSAISGAIDVMVDNKISNIMNGIQLLVILLCIVAGFCLADFSNWTMEGFLPNGFSGVMQGAAASFYAFIGFEGVATAGEETKNPQKVIPLALFTSLGVMAVLYLFQAAALTLMVPYDQIDTQSAFPQAFETLGYPGIAAVVAVGIVIGLAGGLINGLYTTTRIIYAMAQDGLIFEIFGKINARTKTPLFGEIFFGVLAAVLSVIFDVAILVEFLSVGTLIAYTIVSGCSIILHYQSRVAVYDVQLQYLSIENYDVEEDRLKAGRLKSSFKWFACLKSPFPGLAVDVAVLTFAIFFGCFVSVFVYASDELEDLVWWTLFVLILTGIGFLASYVVIIAHHKRRLRLPFNIPSVPFIPALSIALNIVLLANLSGTTWIRLAIWLIIGLVIYFAYGIRHSVLERGKDSVAREFQSSPTDDIQRDPNQGITDLPARGADERYLTAGERTPLLSQNSGSSSQSLSRRIER